MRHQKMNVVVVDARSVVRKRQLRVVTPQGGSGGFEGGQRRPIFTIRRICAAFVFVQAGEGVLNLPLEKNRTKLILSDFVEDAFGFGVIPRLGSREALHQQGVEFVEMVVTGACDGDRLVGIFAGILHIAGSHRCQCEHSQSVKAVLLTVLGFGKIEGLAK